MLELFARTAEFLCCALIGAPAMVRIWRRPGPTKTQSAGETYGSGPPGPRYFRWRSLENRSTWARLTFGSSVLARGFSVLQVQV
jgi:hypothetical protein